MALKNCLDCKKKISSTADVCPYCGSKVPTLFKAISIIIAFLITGFLMRSCDLI